MKRILIAIGLACAMPMMASCDVLSGVQSASVVTSKAMYGVEALYNVPAHAYVTADSRDQISPSLKATLKPKLQFLGTLLDKAREAKRIGNAVLFNSIRDQMKPLSAELSSLIPA